MKSKEAKLLVGKRVEYWFDSDVDRHRGSILVRTGTVTAVAGRNIEISGDWRWLPNVAHMVEIKEA